MKVEWNKKYTTIAIYAFLVISSSIIVYLMVSQAEDLKIKFSGMIATMQPFIIGSAIAYIINFILFRLLQSSKNIKIIKLLCLKLILVMINIFIILYYWK